MTGWWKGIFETIAEKAAHPDESHLLTLLTEAICLTLSGDTMAAVEPDERLQWLPAPTTFPTVKSMVKLLQMQFLHGKHSLPSLPGFLLEEGTVRLASLAPGISTAKHCSLGLSPLDNAPGVAAFLFAGVGSELESPHRSHD